MEESIYLTKEEALTIFCFSDYDSIPVLKEKTQLLTTDYQEFLYRDIKGMLLVSKIYITFKTKEVRFIINDICRRYIDNIYKNEDSIFTFKQLRFLIWFIFVHRNIEDYRKLNKFPINNKHLERFRESLRKLRAIDSYQTEMF